MLPFLSTLWAVLWLLILVAASKQDGKSTILAWALIGVFPPIFYKLMSL